MSDNHLKVIYSEPHPGNFCGGSFQDWLEVNLLSRCNGRCSWCIERDGFHPKKKVGWATIAGKAVESGKKNIILLGGEPTLYDDLGKIISYLKLLDRNVWITTNGSLLSPEYVASTLAGITGINISIHDYDLEKNEKITGIRISNRNLIESIKALYSIGANVRLNCNCISGHIDSFEEVQRYIKFAKLIGADKIRLAELKLEEEKFVDLAEIFNHGFGLNEDPFTYGCIRDVIIDDMPVNIRQMCGLQTSKRKLPINPRQFPKTVLYYDGNFYNGWQTEKREYKMKEKQLKKILKDVADGNISVEEANKTIWQAIDISSEVKESVTRAIDQANNDRRPVIAGAGCSY